MRVVAGQSGSLLADRTVVITGAGRGLGRAYALGVAACGATVVVNDLDEDRVGDTVAAVRKAGGTALGVAGDVSASGFAEALVTDVIARFGALDGVVNNAGVMRTGLPWREPEAELRLQIGVNVIGAVLMGRAALAVMTARGAGALVNITSGAQSGLPHRATYGATKGAISSVTYGWALDAQPYGVRVNALAPVARTPMYAESGDSAAGLADPAEVTPALVYLLSDLSAHLTGRVIRFDGRELSVLGPPGPVAADRRDDAWTIEEVAESCGRGGLREALG